MFFLTYFSWYFFTSVCSFVVGNLSTDLQCYFGCDESFKKDYQLHLHLKLKHRNEDPKELEKAYEAAEEEIALTRRSASIFNCALCPKTFNDNGAFYGHIQVRFLHLYYCWVFFIAFILFLKEELLL